MHCITYFTNKCSSFERSLKNKLKEPISIDVGPRLSYTMGPRRNNVEILFNEIFCRSLLLTARFAKTFFSVAICIISPVSLLIEKLPSPNLARKHFYTEARYFAAESFEIIGVVACSLLLLPLNRKNSPALLNAQAWVEKKAEWISGEKTTIDSIQKIRASAEAKKELLLQVRNVIEVDKEDIEKWIDKDLDFNDLMWRLDVLKHRRICRNYKSIPNQRALNGKLEEIASIISDKIATVAIPKQEETLVRLNRLHNPNFKLNPSNCKESGFLETKLKAFQQLQSEIDKAIDQLHMIHDPEHRLGNAIENLKQEFSQAFSNARQTSLYLTPEKFNLVKCYQEVSEHFFFVQKKLFEIMYIYSYKNVTQSQEEFSDSFASDLMKEINECQKLLKELVLLWETRNTTLLDRPRAFKILGLNESASSADIKKAYYRLSLIHHPDKGGQGNVFNTIHNAYQLLSDT